MSLEKNEHASPGKLKDIAVVTVTVIAFAFIIVLIAFSRIQRYIQQDVKDNVSIVAANSEFTRSLAILNRDIHNLMVSYLRNPEHLENESLWLRNQAALIREKAADSQFSSMGRVPLEHIVAYQESLLKLLDDYQAINQHIKQLDKLHNEFFTLLDEMEEHTAQVMVEQALAGGNVTIYNQILALIPFNREKVFHAQLLIEKAIAMNQPIFSGDDSDTSGDDSDTNVNEDAIENMLLTFKQTANTLTSADIFNASRARMLVQDSGDYLDLVRQLGLLLTFLREDNQRLAWHHDKIIASLKNIDDRTSDAIISLEQDTNALLGRVSIIIYAISAIVLLVYIIGWSLIKQIASRMQLATNLAVQASKDLQTTNAALEEEITERVAAEKQLQIRSLFQTSLNNLLQISLHDLSLEEILDKFLTEITSVVWLGVENKGAIFLTDKDNQQLVLKAERNLDKPLLELCAKVAFGHCVCGRAALKGEVIYMASVDETHETTYEGMKPHGHYIIPLIVPGENRVIGVINLYIKEDTRLNRSEEEIFLPALSRVLTGIIKRKETELALRKAHEELEKRVEERTEQLAEANTSLVSAKQVLEQQNEELKALDKMKDGLVRDVTHELKTPVAKLRMQVDLLSRIIRQHGLESECEKFLNNMESSIKRQESVIHNILDLSRLESGGRQYMIKDLALDQLLLIVIKDFSHLLDAHNIKVEKNLVKLTISSDPEMLFHVFSNLINNAIKYRTLNDEPVIRVDMIQDGDRVKVRIIDNGIGIDRQEKDKVFNRFYQSSVSSEGSGVGLTIAKMIVEDLQGSIDIESKGRNQGLQATVTLPCKAQARYDQI